MKTLTDAQLAEFEQHGAITVDTPFTSAELDAVEAVWDRLCARDDVTTLRTGPRRDAELGGFFDQACLDVFQHAWIEAAAKQLLLAEAVHLYQTAGTIVWPASPGGDDSSEGGWQAEWAQAAHIDTQTTWADFTARPRRTILCIWLWLSDVPAERGAMRYVPVRPTVTPTTDPWHRPHLLRPRPTPGQRYSACLQGSHRPIASHWETALSDEHRTQLPRVHGLRLQPTPAVPSYPEIIPDADRWLGTEPTAVVARRGQATLITTSVVHSAWKNRDAVPRKAIQCQITAAGVSIGHPRSECEAVSKLYPELRRRFRPERQHLAMPSPIIHRESGHEDKWLEGGHVRSAAAKL